METEKLIKLIETQNELINILCFEYRNTHRSPLENNRVAELQKNLESLQKELVL